jgi:hypothetical protein
VPDYDQGDLSREEVRSAVRGVGVGVMSSSSPQVQQGATSLRPDPLEASFRAVPARGRAPSHAVDSWR